MYDKACGGEMSVSQGEEVQSGRRKGLQGTLGQAVQFKTKRRSQQGLMCVALCRMKMSVGCAGEDLYP